MMQLRKVAISYERHVTLSEAKLSPIAVNYQVSSIGVTSLDVTTISFEDYVSGDTMKPSTSHRIALARAAVRSAGLLPTASRATAPHPRRPRWHRHLRRHRRQLP
jgi:hypothetical protein